MQTEDDVVPSTGQTVSDFNPSIQNSKPKTDENSATGRKWSILIMLLITSIALVIIMVAWMSEGNTYSLHKGYMYGFLFLLMLFGVISMTCLCFINRCDRKPNDDNHSRRNSNDNNKTCLKFIYFLPFAILVLFALGSVVQDFMECIELVNCFYVFRDRYKLGWNLAYHVIKIIYIIYQAGFICFFRFKQIQCKNWCTRVLLLVIPAADICIWFYVLTTEWEHVTNKHSTGKNVTLHFVEVDSEQCLNRDNEVSQANKDSQQYLYPLTMEFCLTALGMLCTIWNLKGDNSHSDRTNREPEATSQGTLQTHSITSDSHPDLTDIETKETCQGTTQTPPLASYSHPKHTDRGPGATRQGTPQTPSVAPFCNPDHMDRETKETCQGTPQTPPLVPDSHHVHTDRDTEATTQGTSQRPPITSDSLPERKRFLVLNIIFICFLMLMLLVPVVLGFLIDKYSECLVPYCIFYMLVQVIIFLATSMSWFFLIQGDGCPSMSAQFGPDQVLLIVSGCVLFILTVFELVPSYVYIAQETTTTVDHVLNLLLAADMFLLLSVFLQTSLVLKDHFVWKDEYYQWLKVCFQVLIACNFYMWFDDSFLAVRLNPYIFKKHPLVIPESDWILIQFILMPPCIFYRIHVAHMCSVKYFSVKKVMKPNIFCNLPNEL